MAKKDITFKVYFHVTTKQELNNNEKQSNPVILKAPTFKSLSLSLKSLMSKNEIIKVIYTNKRGTMITRFYFENKLKKEVRIYPDKRTGKNDY